MKPTLPFRRHAFWPVLLLLALVAVAQLAAAPARPNIVLILSDDMGYSDLGCFGGEIHTPNLDKLAAEGVRFTQFYNTGRCCPTRASLLTGLYSHQAGIGHMMADKQLPGYTGELGRDCVTIGEVLQAAGYHTYMGGKWHVSKSTAVSSPKNNWPLQRGFEKFYGTIAGGGSYYDPTTLCRGNDYITPENDPAYRPDRFYYTDAITDNVLDFLREHEQRWPAEPFFLYVAYTAAHWPMQAPEETIAKYHGKYDAGYDAIRRARVERMRRLGLLPAQWNVPTTIGHWDQVKDKEWETRCMEVYAAMVDRMDTNIGRLIEQLRRQGVLTNTLIFFLQDNGGCAEGVGRQKGADAPADLKPMKPDELQPRVSPPMQTRDGRWVRTGPGVMPGPADSYVAYGRNWANVSNTPFRQYKHWEHEGGISTPLIVHWPAGLSTMPDAGAPREGRLIDQPAHLIDIMATCVAVSGAKYPAEFHGRALQPMEGVSLVPAWQGRSLERSQPLFFEHEGNRAVRDGRWKLVASGPRGAWELYDMEADRAETKDLAAEQPERVGRMAAQWEAWARRARVLPWPWKTSE